MSFAMLSGAGLVKGREGNSDKNLDTVKIYTHSSYDMVVEENTELGKVCRLTDEQRNGATLVVSKEAPIYPITLDSAGAQANFLSAVTDKQVFVEDKGVIGDVVLSNKGEITNADAKTLVFQLASADDNPGDSRQDEYVHVGDTVRIDCYEVHTDGAVELQIDADNFAGYYYIEASTLFRDEATGADLPAEFVVPRGKIQSNWTFSMAASGDPSEQYFQSEYRMAA